MPSAVIIVFLSFVLQTDLREVAESIERQIPPQDIFRSVAENAVQLYANGTGPEGLLDVLCSDEHLATVSILLHVNCSKYRCLHMNLHEMSSLVRSIHSILCWHTYSDTLAGAGVYGGAAA